MKRKESILDVLKNGTHEKDEYNIVVKNGNFRAVFPNTCEVKWFADSLKKFDKKVRNRCEYGDEKGSAAFRKENETSKKLAELIKHPEDCRRYFRLYKISLNAPHELQPYVFENAKVFMKNDGEKFSVDCDFYLAGIIPPKYIAGCENVNTHDFGWEYAVEDLTPVDVYKIGTEVQIKGKRKLSGKIVGYKFFREERHLHIPNSGKFVVWYDVRFGASRYDHAEYKFEEILLAPAV